MKNLIVGLLLLYKKYTSPLLVRYFGHSCRFTPTCSEYAKDAISEYGVMKGMWFAGKRIHRCNPLSKPGFDPLVKAH